MSLTRNADAIAFANDVIAIASQVREMLAALQRLQLRQAKRDFVTVLNSMPTYALNADGSQGATDATPNTSHPIVGLNRSASDLGAMIGYGINDTVSFWTGVGTPGYTDRTGAVGNLLP